MLLFIFLNIYKCSQYFYFTLNDQGKTHQKWVRVTWATRYNVNRRPHHHFHGVNSVQLLSRVQLSVTPWIAALQASLSINNSQSSLRLMCIESVMPPTSPSLSIHSPAHISSQHQDLFQWVNSSHQVAKVLELQLQHQSFQWTHRTDHRLKMFKVEHI